MSQRHDRTRRVRARIAATVTAAPVRCGALFGVPLGIATRGVWRRIRTTRTGWRVDSMGYVAGCWWRWSWRAVALGLRVEVMKGLGGPLVESGQTFRSRMAAVGLASRRAKSGACHREGFGEVAGELGQRSL